MIGISKSTQKDRNIRKKVCFFYLRNLLDCDLFELIIFWSRLHEFFAFLFLLVRRKKNKKKKHKTEPGLKTDLELGLNLDQTLTFSSSAHVKRGSGTAHLQNHHLFRAEEGDVSLCPLCQQCHQAHQQQATRHGSTHAHSAPSWTRKHACLHTACMQYNKGWEGALRVRVLAGVRPHF